MPPVDRPVHHGFSSSSLRQLVASKPGHLHVEPSPIYYRILKKAQSPNKKIFTTTKEDVLMESKHAFLVWQCSSPSPKLAFLRQDVRFVEDGTEEGVGLRASEMSHENLSNELASQYYDLYLGESEPFSRSAAWSFQIDAPLTEWTSKDAPSPDQLIVLDLKKLPEIWEEDVRVEWGSVRNPYHRVDTVVSSRRAQVFALSKDGKQKHLVADTADLASSQQAKALFETGYTTRWYLPASAIEPGTLAGSKLSPAVGTPTSGFGKDSKTTVCPYKGVAHYHSVTLPDGDVLPDVAWSYPDQIPALDLRGLIAFWAPGNDRLQLYIDEQLVQ